MSDEGQPEQQVCIFENVVLYQNKFIYIANSEWGMGCTQLY